MTGRTAAATPVLAVVLAILPSCGRTAGMPQRTFTTPEQAVETLTATVASGDVLELVRIFGDDASKLLDTSDPEGARQRREVFTVAMAEEWQLEGQGDERTLIIGNERWPFPVPLVRGASGWRFDTAAGLEEIIARRIGRNELAVIGLCLRYVAAQNFYAREARDGVPAGTFAQHIRSDPGRHNGLYWPAGPRERPSPLGDLIAAASPVANTSPAGLTPFHGYYFRILKGQGPSAPGGARDYVVNGAMSGGFALVAWPAEYDVTGVATFIVNRDGIVHEKDLGPDTVAAVERITRYDPDPTWQAVP